jgi:hypothetical protein
MRVGKAIPRCSRLNHSAQDESKEAERMEEKYIPAALLPAYTGTYSRCAEGSYSTI